MLIKAKDLTGRFAVDIESGKEVFDLIQLSIRFNVSSITLDFDGVDCFTSTFFHYSLGQLYRDFEANEISRKLIVKGLSHNNIALLNKVLELARKYYGQPNGIVTAYRKGDLAYG